MSEKDIKSPNVKEIGVSPINIDLNKIKVEGIVIVRDKNGNIKQKVRVTNEVDRDATK